MSESTRSRITILDLFRDTGSDANPRFDTFLLWEIRPHTGWESVIGDRQFHWELLDEDRGRRAVLDQLYNGWLTGSPFEESRGLTRGARQFLRWWSESKYAQAIRKLERLSRNRQLKLKARFEGVAMDSPEFASLLLQSYGLAYDIRILEQAIQEYKEKAQQD